MKSGQKIRTLLFTLAALSVPGSAIASTNLTCKIDCPSPQMEVAKDAHACCLKLTKQTRLVEKLAEKCDNCIESREIPSALNAQYQPVKTEIVAISHVEHFGKCPSLVNQSPVGRTPQKNRFHHPNSVSITLHRFLI